MAITSSQNSGVHSVMGRCLSAMPALFTKMSMRPKALMVSSTALTQSAGLDRSA